jgi:hypothetical protein
MTAALEGGEWSAARPNRNYPRERAGTHCTGGWVGPTAGLDRCGKSRPTGFRLPDRPARSRSLYRLSYPRQRCTGLKLRNGTYRESVSALQCARVLPLERPVAGCWGVMAD